MHGGKRDGSGRKAGSVGKITAEIRQIAQPYGEEAVATLVAIMRGEAQPPAARVAAAKEVLDRGFGKSMQKIDTTSSDGTMTPKGLGDFYAALKVPAAATDA